MFIICMQKLHEMWYINVHESKNISFLYENVCSSWVQSSLMFSCPLLPTFVLSSSAKQLTNIFLSVVWQREEEGVEYEWVINYGLKKLSSLNQNQNMAEVCGNGFVTV